MALARQRSEHTQRPRTRSNAAQQDSTGRRFGRSPWLPLAAIVLLAALLRFPTLTTQSIWFDEAATWELMRRPFGAMVSALPSHESNPPLFYVLEWIWIRIFGDGAFGLRSLPALLGTLTVPIAYGIGRRLGGPRAALATAALVAVNPLLVWFSQEARSYELVVFLSALSLLLFLRCLDDDRPRALAWWAIVSALALCSHYFAVFVLVPQAVWLLWRHPRRRAAVAVVAMLTAVGAALLPMLLKQRGNPYDIAAESIGVRLLQIPKQFLLGYRGPLAALTIAVGAVVVAAAVWLLLRRVDERPRRRALGVGAIGLIGLALPVAGSVVGADYLNARNVIPALVPLAAALGVGYAAGRTSRLGIALLTILCGMSLAIVATVAAEQQYQRPDWKGLARALGHADGPRAIVVSPGNGDPPLRFYRRTLRRMGREGANVREIDVVGVAGSDGPGSPPRLPELYLGRTELAVPGWPEPLRIQTPSWVILRYRVSRALFVPPDPLGAVRFSEYPPSVDVLPASR